MKFMMYLSTRNGKDVVTDFEGTTSYRITHIKTSFHNIAGKRYDYWFYDNTGHLCHGYTIGGNTLVAHCQRTKERSTYRALLYGSIKSDPLFKPAVLFKNN